MIHQQIAFFIELIFLLIFKWNDCFSRKQSKIPNKQINKQTKIMKIFKKLMMFFG